MVAKQETRASSTGAETKPLGRIAALNDAFRKDGGSGMLAITDGVIALGHGAVFAILAAVRAYDRFDEGNDPYGEHDFGALEWQGSRVFWKIDAYDRTLRAGSPDPADPSVTRRVLTVMLAEEY